MGSFLSGKLSAAKTGWLLALLFFGWLAFLMMPGPTPKPKPVPTYIPPPSSRLVALGLPDNPDLEHLPDFFALFADKAEWKDDKTIFAYWNPGSNSYSYFFEATRVDGAIRFKTISEPDPNKYWTDERTLDGSLFRFYWSFDVVVPKIGSLTSVDSSGTAPLKLPINSDYVRIVIPPPEFKLPALDLEQKK